MDRREFIAVTSASALTVAASGCTAGAAIIQPAPLRPSSDPIALDRGSLAEAPPPIQKQFDELVAWLDATGWTAFLNRVSGVDLHLRGPSLEEELLRRIDPPRHSGFEDFGGVRTVQPGQPARSLLYHALASPKVKLTGADGTPAPPLSYPSVEQLDALENYIYARLKLGGYRIGGHPVEVDDMVLAVFAYEFRPADKTPHGLHSDLVFSRTGIARVGTHEMVYAPEQRCFVNQPAAHASGQDLAVTPARYSLFLAKPVVGAGNLSLLGVEGNIFNGRRDRSRTFLLPFRKVFTGDDTLGVKSIAFAESHLNEKLLRLSQGKGVELPAGVFDLTRPPFVRRSSTSTLPSFTPDPRHHNTELVTLTQQGSSVLLAATKGSLISEAWQTVGGRRERVRILVPPTWRARYSGNVTNRRYTTLKLEQHPHWNAVDFAVSDGLAGGGSRTTGVRSPRNAPAFVNIRYEVRKEDGEAVRYLGASKGDYERIRAGGYWAAVFEDRICDGCVQAVVTPSGSPLAGGTEKSVLGAMLSKQVRPAYSLVTAPDFFPLVDGADLEEFDGQFLEGGTEMLSGGRLRANENIWLPGSEEVAFPAPRVNDLFQYDDPAYTVTAVLTDAARRGPWFRSTTRNYVSTNTLPDTASNVFAPGWDATYSGERGGDLTLHLSTVGLGLPFPEDIKLCAAANGMWPGASPDAARTFQGTLKPIPIGWGRSRKPPTAVPLLDYELGYHGDSPAVRDYGRAAAFGWDGEHGPFLSRQKDTGHIHVNFADVNAADYVRNALEDRMNASLLRDLTSGEMIARMDALRRCIAYLPGGDDPRHTKLWLVSAERVENWNEGAEGLGIPADLFDGRSRWATVSRLSRAGLGFLYVFVDTKGESQPVPGEPERHTQPCASIYICQVSGGRLAWIGFRGDATTAPPESAWKVANR